MSIKDGEIASSDEVMNAMGSIFNDAAQNLFNADYIGFDSRLNGSGNPNLDNIDYDTFTSDSMNITGDVFYVSTNDSYIGGEFDNIADYTVFDDCDNSSVDASKWNTAGSVSESTFQKVSTSITTAENSTGSSTSISLDWDNYKVLNIDIIELKLDAGGTGTSWYKAGIQLGTEVVYEVKINGDQSNVTLTDLKFQSMRVPTGYYYRIYNGSSWGGWSFYANTSQIEVQLYANKTWGGTCSISFNNVRFIDSSSGTGTLISDGITTDSITNLIPVWNGFKNNSGHQIAADGSTYETVTNKIIHRPSTVGTNPKIKFTFVNFDEIFEYAFKYNFY